MAENAEVRLELPEVRPVTVSISHTFPRSAASDHAPSSDSQLDIMKIIPRMAERP